MVAAEEVVFEEGAEEEVGGKSLPEMAVVVVAEEVFSRKEQKKRSEVKVLPFYLRQCDTFCWVCTVQLQQFSGINATLLYSYFL